MGNMGFAFLVLLALAVDAGAARSSSPLRKIYAAGSGLDMLSQPDTVSEIITLSGKSNPKVLYVGTATYDTESARDTQTRSFIAQGCTIDNLDVALTAPSADAMAAQVRAADVVLVSGGNTLFAVDRWVKVGLDALLHEAVNNGTVLCGGSAGGIVWFDGGHSDSMESSSYKNPPGPFLRANPSPAELANWAYIRVPGVSIVPGLFCPHYDVTESNGVLRSSDFTGMLQRHSGEYGIGVDNWGALMVHGDRYTVISRKGKPGSVDANGHFTKNNQHGRPGAWLLEIDQSDGSLKRTLVPDTGFVSDLLRPARFIAQSEQLPVARGQNPDDGLPPSPTLKLHD